MISVKQAYLLIQKVHPDKVFESGVITERENSFIAGMVTKEEEDAIEKGRYFFSLSGTAVLKDSGKIIDYDDTKQDGNTSKELEQLLNLYKEPIIKTHKVSEL